MATDEFLKTAKQQVELCDILAKEARNVRMSKEQKNIFTTKNIKKYAKEANAKNISTTEFVGLNKDANTWPQQSCKPKYGCDRR